MDRKSKTRFNIGIVLLCFLAVSVTVQATENKDAAWLKRSEQIIKEAEQLKELPEWLRTEPTEEAKAFAKHVLEESKKKLPDELMAGEDTKEFEELQKRSVIAFISYSMPDAELKALMHAASGEEVMLVLRGMKDNTSINNTLTEAHRLAKGIDPLPNVSINPKLFKELDIKVVPTLVTGYGTNRVVQARGTIGIKWFREQAASLLPGMSTDLGKRGQTYEIAETDMTDVIKTRMAKLDLEAKKNQAFKGYWKRFNGIIDLPPATEEKVFTVDPTIVVTENIAAPDGTVFAHKGDRLNPLTTIPFTKTVIVFDATSKTQLEKAKEIADEVRSRDRGIILVTTNIDKDKGWDFFPEIQEYLQYRVYVLNQEMVDRFHLEKVPSVIKQNGLVFEIREVKATI